FFRDGAPQVVEVVERCLDRDLAAIGDLVYCEVMQGLRRKREIREISSLFLSLPQFEMVGFGIAERAAHNYRTLRSRGVTVRKTIDVLIGTFCADNNLSIIHHDRDFDLMAEHIGLDIWRH
ncbi:MAG: PIN domain-containing protein, partial [Candidatus Hydrogenedentes bacterium]|nr:PIN domain-containing protein [Candidatus Hydrogenedentota bacterium]